ncbi:MAG: hypothetical protein ACRCYU_05135 [Nocardioides sp.]
MTPEVTPGANVPEIKIPPAGESGIPGPDRRWRCAGCGNLTRFDITRVRRTTEYWHFDLAGNRTVEDIEVLMEKVDTVVCRWCGRADAIHLLVGD